MIGHQRSVKRQMWQDMQTSGQEAQTTMTKCKWNTGINKTTSCSWTIRGARRSTRQMHPQDFGPQRRNSQLVESIGSTRSSGERSKWSKKWCSFLVHAILARWMALGGEKKFSHRAYNFFRWSLRESQTVPLQVKLNSTQLKIVNSK